MSYRSLLMLLVVVLSPIAANAGIFRTCALALGLPYSSTFKTRSYLYNESADPNGEALRARLFENAQAQVKQDLSENDFIPGPFSTEREMEFVVFVQKFQAIYGGDDFSRPCVRVKIKTREYKRFRGKIVSWEARPNGPVVKFISTKGRPQELSLPAYSFLRAKQTGVD